MISGVAGLRPNFFLQRPNFLAELAQESWRDLAALVPDGRIQGRWTQKWPSKISCGLGSQRPRKRPNFKFPNCSLILTIIGKNLPKNLYKKSFSCTSSDDLGGGRLAA
jgi:hypothetical protein